MSRLLQISCKYTRTVQRLNTCMWRSNPGDHDTYTSPEINPLYMYMQLLNLQYKGCTVYWYTYTYLEHMTLIFPFTKSNPSDGVRLRNVKVLCKWNTLFTLVIDLILELKLG